MSQITQCEAGHYYDRDLNRKCPYCMPAPHATIFSASEAILRDSLRHKFIYSITGLVLGLICILGGIALFLNGIAGSTNWTAKLLGNETKLTDAAPGTILFIVGLFITIATKYKVKLDYDTTASGSKVTYMANEGRDDRDDKMN